MADAAYDDMVHLLQPKLQKPALNAMCVSVEDYKLATEHQA